jgi:hypothetical protein
LPSLAVRGVPPAATVAAMSADRYAKLRADAEDGDHFNLELIALSRDPAAAALVRKLTQLTGYRSHRVA